MREEGLTLDVVAKVAPSSAVTSGSLRISSIELTPCPSTAATVWRWLSPIGTAWAHGETTGPGPLVVRIDSPVDLLAAGEQPLGTLRPPPGRYCRLVARLGATDTDGGTLATLRLEGAALSLETDELRPLTLDYDALALDEDAPHAALALELDLGRALVDVDPSSPGAAGECLSHLARDARVTHQPR